MGWAVGEDEAQRSPPVHRRNGLSRQSVCVRARRATGARHVAPVAVPAHRREGGGEHQGKKEARGRIGGGTAGLLVEGGYRKS